jgi:hypothetical protein
MPRNYKTSINNLIIVWQGSNWSVIAPDGSVIFRSFNKVDACDFARSYTDYAGKNYSAYSGSMADIEDKPKNDFEDGLTGQSPAVIYMQPNRVKAMDFVAASQLNKGGGIPPRRWLLRFGIWVAKGIFQIIRWVVEATLIVLLFAGAGGGIMVGSFVGLVAFVSGLCVWVTGGWPFEAQVFPNSLVITGLAFVICVICYRIIKVKRLDKW